jgi:hypothetical protein
MRRSTSLLRVAPDPTTTFARCMTRLPQAPRTNHPGNGTRWATLLRCPHVHRLGAPGLGVRGNSQDNGDEAMSKKTTRRAVLARGLRNPGRCPSRGRIRLGHATFTRSGSAFHRTSPSVTVLSHAVRARVVRFAVGNGRRLLRALASAIAAHSFP